MRMIDVDYSLFMNRLKKAGTDGHRIEKKDRERWKAYVKKHNVKEAASQVHARAICDNMTPVIIDSDDSWNGYYLFSKREQICLKYDPGR